MTLVGTIAEFRRLSLNKIFLVFGNSSASSSACILWFLFDLNPEPAVLTTSYNTVPKPNKAPLPRSPINGGVDSKDLLLQVLAAVAGLAATTTKQTAKTPRNTTTTTTTTATTAHSYEISTVRENFEKEQVAQFTWYWSCCSMFSCVSSPRDHFLTLIVVALVLALLSELWLQCTSSFGAARRSKLEDGLEKLLTTSSAYVCHRDQKKPRLFLTSSLDRIIRLLSRILHMAKRPCRHMFGV